VARILALSPFSLEIAREEVDSGRSPDQILYGLNYFEQRGHTVRSIPSEQSPRLRKATQLIRRSPIPLGELDQQWAALRAMREVDLVYCPTQGVAQLLSFLRAAGRFDRPIVTVVHQADRGRLSRPRRPVTRAMLRGVDAYPAMTGPLVKELARIAGTEERTMPLKFGPDAHWYPRSAEIGRGVVAVGRSNRDFETFFRAAEQTHVPAWIVCREELAPQNAASSHIRVVTHRHGSGASMLGIAPRDLVDLYARARAVAIPLHDRWPWPLSGLTSMADALGMGKATIVTRNPWLDIDVEALGIGIWVRAGDVDGWREAITYLDEQPEVALEMGRRARALVDTGERSSATFASQLLEIFDRVLTR
jgi:glycosyltransferase involved in cell wall biosynthesis